MDRGVAGVIAFGEADDPALHFHHEAHIGREAAEGLLRDDVGEPRVLAQDSEEPVERGGRSAKPGVDALGREEDRPEKPAVHGGDAQGVTDHERVVEGDELI